MKHRSSTTSILLLGVLILVGGVNAGREKIMEDRLFNRYCRNIRSSQVCKYMNDRGAFDVNLEFPNGCNMCRCIFPTQGSCSGPTCPTANSQESETCDRLLNDIRAEIGTRHTECVSGADFCPRYPKGVYNNGCNNCFCRSSTGYTCLRTNVCPTFKGTGAQFADYCKNKNAGYVAATWDEYLAQ